MDDRQDRYERSLLFRRIQPSHELRTGFQAVHPTREGGSIPPIQGIGKRGGNHLHSSFKYQEVEWVEEDNESHKWKSLDLTNYYKLSSDTVPIIRDSTYWNIHRDNPLSPDEAHLYSKAQEQNISKIDTADDLQKYVKLTEQLTNTVNMDYKTTRN